MIGSVVGFLLAVGIPVGAAVFFLWCRDKSFRSFLAGAAAFGISQLVLRLPLLRWLGQNCEWYIFMPYTNTALYFIFQGITAGLFEETGRWIGLSLTGRNQKRWVDGLAFGLGHGGIEAMWIGFQGILPVIINKTPGWMGLISGVERMFAVMIQVGLTFVVLYGVRRRQVRYWILAVLLHGLVDFLIILGNVWIVEGILSCEAMIAAIWVLYTRKKIGEEF